MPQNYLDLFPVNHVGAFMARTVIFIQLVTLVPLLLFIIRLQLFGAIFKVGRARRHGVCEAMMETGSTIGRSLPQPRHSTQ